MSNTEVIKAIEGIADTVEGFKAVHEKRTGRIEAENAALRERIELLEAHADRPKGAPSSAYSRDQKEHCEVFSAWLRKPNDGMQKRRLEEAQHETTKSEHGTKAVVIGTGSTGGYAVPTIIDSAIEARVRMLNPWRSLVRVVTVGSSDYKHIVSKNNSTSGWAGETDSRSETTTSDLIECAPTFGFVFAYPRATEEAMQDVFFDVLGWLTEETADAFAAAEAQAVVSGNGTSKPTGFLTTTPSATDDDGSPERAATALEYLPLTSSPQALNVDDLITLSMSIKERYLLDSTSVAWAMRRSVASTIRKLKDDNGQYLWQPSTQAGMPNMLLGYPVALTDSMPAATADQYPVAFGNWRRAYLLADRSGIEITVDSNITTPGYTKFYLRRRVGGKVLNHEAVKLLKFAD